MRMFAYSIWIWRTFYVCTLLLFLFVAWRDIESLAWFDLVMLAAMTASLSWAIGSNNRWLKVFVGALLLFGTFIVTQSLEPVLRSLSSQLPSQPRAYNDGIKAYYDAMRAYRPFTLLATGGLFLILVSAGIAPKNHPKNEPAADE